MQLLCCFCVLIILQSSSGINGKSTKERIYGGSYARIGEFPYMVSLRKDGKHDCGGALITRKHVLTAYHCVNTGYDNLTAVVGTNSITTGGEAYLVVKVFVYPPFDNHIIKEFYDHDIAVLTLKQEVKLSRFVSTIPLPESEVKIGARVQFTGWGDDYTQQNSKFLQKLTVTTLYRDACELHYQNYGYGYLVKNRTICTLRNVGYGACFGDSGAPLIYNGTIVGVLSISFNQCAMGTPDLFGNVHSYLTFIKYAVSRG